MKKKDIIAELQKLKNTLDLTPEEYIEKFNNSHSDLTPLKREDYYPFMVGFVDSTIEFILTERW